MKMKYIVYAGTSGRATTETDSLTIAGYAFNYYQQEGYDWVLMNKRKLSLDGAYFEISLEATAAVMKGEDNE
jgi:hypothetical protein